MRWADDAYRASWVLHVRPIARLASRRGRASGGACFAQDSRPSFQANDTPFCLCHTGSLPCRFQAGCQVGQMRGELRLDDFEWQGRERADEVADLASLAVLCGDRFLEEGIGHQVAFQLRLRLGGVATQHEGKPRLDP